MKDLALIVSDTPASVAALFTKNRVPSPSVTFSRNVLKKTKSLRAIIINSGNANAATGSKGYKDCRLITSRTAELLGVSYKEVLIASTGIIGVPLPTQTIINGIPKLISGLEKNGWGAASDAILTTDMVSKTAQTHILLGGKKVLIAGIAKGSGMIHPNMATMLGFIVTDSNINSTALNVALRKAVDPTFNAISVDAEPSTNDCVIAMANGQAGNAPLRQGSANYQKFVSALEEVCRSLAWKVVKDGEGATKFLTVCAFGGKSSVEAKKVAERVARSNLVKTAMFGQDPNWGRIIAAMGNAGVSIKIDKIEIRLNGILLVTKGQPVPTPKAELTTVMKKKNIRIELFLNQGNFQAEVYTCDLSYDYIKINAEYTT
tara:strand:+ start:79 stop:1203 length:1125 start_codon:yes stop_codon:yes gene_type:complete